MKLVLELILLIIVVNAIVLDKALMVLSPKELKRRAYQNSQAKAVYKMTGYGHTLHLLLWIKGSLAAAILFIMLASWSGLAAIVFILIVAWAVKGWNPTRTTSSWIWTWAAKVAPLVSTVMSYIQPLLMRLSGLLPGSNAEQRDEVYEKEDLQDFLNKQNSRPENRIPETDLKMAFNALTFGDKDVSSVMTPLRKVRMVTENEVIGPLLMDELHSTGFSRFPVIKESKDAAIPQITGTLYIKDLIDHSQKGKVADLMDRKVYYINETQKLRDALGAFLKTHHHLFVVVNNFEEIVGVISIEDVLEQILGQSIVDEFDKYDDLRAVAAKDADLEHNKHLENHIEPDEQA